MRSGNFIGRLAASLACVALLSHATSIPAQVGDLYKGFKLPDYYKSGRLKSQITGAEARPQPNGLWLAETVRIENLLEDGRTNLVAITPQCFVDIKNHVAFSERRLEVVTASGQLNIQGEGFFYEQTNFNLTISNHVETTIHRELIRSTNVSTSLPSPLAKTNAPAGSDLTKIFSDHFFLESPSNLAIYSGQVQVDDAQMEMGCQTLTIQRSPEGTIESIMADREVAMTNKLDQSRAMGDHAVYFPEPGRERVILTGQQARWEDGEKAGRAGMFTFDRGANTVRAEQKPSMKLPRGAIITPDWMPGSPGIPVNPPASTNQFVDISAEEILIELASTNQLGRRMVAQSEVLIVSLADKSRATSERTVYDEAAGTLELTGHAVWQSDQRLVKGETLLFDRTNQVLRAHGDAYLRMPVSSLGGQASPPSQLKKPASPDTVEVFSDGFIYQPAALAFQDNVRANYFQGAAQRGWLTSGFLSVGFNSNRIETLVAATAVTVEQPAIDTNSGHRVEKKLSCEILKMRFYTNGLVQSAVAQTNVFAQQTETRAGRARATQTELRAGLAKLFFFAHTNQVRELIAEREVSIAQDTKSAHGDRAVYTATNDIVELSGSPTADMPLGRITEAEVLIWDRGHNTLRGKGKTVVGVGEVPGKRAPRAGLLLPK